MLLKMFTLLILSLSMMGCSELYEEHNCSDAIHARIQLSGAPDHIDSFNGGSFYEYDYWYWDKGVVYTYSWDLTQRLIGSDHRGCKQSSYFFNQTLSTSLKNRV